MKAIVAYIKPHKLESVTLALHHVEGLSGVSVVDVRGFGRGRASDAPHTIKEGLADFIPHVRLEIVCRDALVEPIVETIRREAHTGLRGDGKIFVWPVEDAVRISTGERGEVAV
ncbi:transcriptional regulator [Rhodothermaceae bacterium RA]|nr:transcriptional regulator [Rhodothermaceae bacterium RA]